jgi:hypothetical protein
MNLGVIPALVSLVAVGLLVLGVGVGLLLQLGQRSAAAGRRLVRYSAASCLSAIVFAWAAALPLGAALGLAFGEEGVLIGLWVSGPLGLLVGLWWTYRHPGDGRSLPGKSVLWWVLGGLALGLLALGLLLTWQGYKESQPPRFKGKTSEVFRATGVRLAVASRIPLRMLP